jgi:hypothetical protein
VAGQPGGAADTGKIRLEETLDLHGNPILEQVFPLGQRLWGQSAEALFGKGAIGRTTEIHLGIDKAMPAVLASPGGIILEKLDTVTASGAFDFVDGPRFPELGILSGTLHRLPPWHNVLGLTSRP